MFTIPFRLWRFLIIVLILANLMSWGYVAIISNFHVLRMPQQRIHIEHQPLDKHLQVANFD